MQPSWTATTGTALTLLGTALFAHPAQATETITFDTVNNAPPAFGFVTPGGSFGPTVTAPGVTFTGGVILSDSNFHNEANTQPNFDVTSDTAILNGGSTLPGIVTGTFSSPGLFSSIALYVANGGNDAGTFSLTAYNSSNAVIGSNSVSLSSQGNGALSVGRATFTGPNIDYFTVTSSQAPGAVVFGVDTITLTSPAAPEPSQAGMMALIALSVGGLLLRARRNKAA